MDFNRMMSRVIPTLRELAASGESRARVEDAEDLFQRMSIHLWRRWQAGDLENKTERYILQSADVHLQNYLRSIENGFKLFSLDTPLPDDPISWPESFVAPEELDGPSTEAWPVVHPMRNNGLSVQE